MPETNPPTDEETSIAASILAHTFAGRIWAALRGTVPDMLAPFETALQAVLDTQIGNLATEGKLTPAQVTRMRALMTGIHSPFKLLNTGLLLLTAFVMSAKKLGGVIGTYGELVDQQVRATAQIEIPAPGDLIELLVRMKHEHLLLADPHEMWAYTVEGMPDRDDFIDMFQRHGIGEQARRMLIMRAQTPADFDTIDEARRREIIPGSTLYDSLYFQNQASAGLHRLREAMLYRIPDEGMLLEAFRRGKTDWAATARQLKMAGAGQVRIDTLEKTYTRLIGESQLLELHRRGAVDRDELKDRLVATGYEADDATEVTNLAKTLPGASHLIELAKRGVLSSVQLTEGLGLLGYSGKDSSRIAKLERTLVGAADAFAMRRRGILTPDALGSVLTERGFRAVDKAKLIDLSRPAPDFDVLVRSMWRNGVDPLDEADALQDSGFPSRYLAEYIKAARPLVDPAGMIRNWRRGTLPAGVTIEAELARWGYEAAEIEKLKTATEVRPGVSDMVRFAVREAYRPGIVARYKLDQDFPPQFTAEAAKLGLPEQYAKYYWRAHWGLPSVQMGYEMMHRGVIDRKELSTLLRIADVMPFWRDKLMEISYRLPTRVDARRMYKHGIIGRPELVSLYKKQGYATKWANHMADLAISMATESDREATKADVLRFYREAQLSDTDARSALAAMGYAAELIDLYLAREDVAASDDRRKLGLKLVETRYKKGLADLPETTTALTDLGYTPSEVSYWTDLWEIQRAKGIHLLSKTELKTLYQKKLISREQVIDELGRIGYDTGRAELIVRTWP